MSDMERLYAGFRKAKELGDTDKMKRIGAYIRQQESQQAQEPEATPQQAYEEHDPMEGMSVLDKTLVGVGKGMTNVGRAVQDGYYRATDNEDALDKLNSRIESERAGWEHLSDNSTAANVGEVLGEVAATAPLGGVAGAGVKTGLAKLGAKRLATAGAVATEGAVSTGVLQRGGIDERLDAAESGAAWGLGTAGVLGLGGKLLRKGLNAGKNFTTDVAKRADDIAETTGIPVHAPDAMPHLPILNKIEGVVNDVPFVGTASGKVKQNQASKEFTEEFVTRHGHNTLGEAEDAVQASIREAYEGVKSKKGELYNKFWDGMEDFGDVPRARTDEYIQKLLAKEAKANGVGSPHTKLLKNILETKDGSASTLHRQFQQVRAKAKAGVNSGGIDKHTAEEMGTLADLMKADAADFAKVIDDTGLAEVESMSKALREADDYFIKNVLPFKENPVLKAAINSNEPEKILRSLNTNGGSSVRASAAYNALNREGQQRMQSAFLLDAFEKSMKDDVFSPKTFRTHIKKMSKTTGVLFKGEDKILFDRLADVLEFTKHSAEASANPMNGSRMVIGGLLAGGVATSAALTAKVASAAALFKVATQTKSGRRLLTASMKRTDETKAMDFVVDYLGKYTGRAAALDASVSDDIPDQ